ncbi:hypothetical protein CH249_25825 [Rhodococcus sp. 05-2255-3B1]|nr:hypothetical protein CH249_25825 [Rhodococcus sp. 05-2255-3B1]
MVERIAAVLAEHRASDGFEECSCGYGPESFVFSERRSLHLAHQASVVAALPDIEIVPSTEPTRTGRYQVGNLATQVWTEDANSTFGTSPLLHIGHPGRYTMVPVRLAGELASAVLAAARAAGGQA